MTHRANHPEPHDETTPADLRGPEALLRRLAERDRAAAPAGFEERLLARTGGVIARAPAPASIPFPGARRWRLAAGLLLVAGAGLAAALWRSGGPGAPSIRAPLASAPPAEDASLHADLDSFLTEFESVEGAVLADATDEALDPADEFWSDGDLPTDDPAQGAIQ
jgi:hypothetical protein